MFRGWSVCWKNRKLRRYTAPVERDVPVQQIGERELGRLGAIDDGPGDVSSGQRRSRAQGQRLDERFVDVRRRRRWHQPTPPAGLHHRGDARCDLIDAASGKRARPA